MTTQGRVSRSYVDGNTVRRMEAAPDRYIRRENERKIKERQKREEEQRRREAAARRNKEHALMFGRGYVAFLTMAAIVVALSAVGYIGLQSAITSDMKQISSLQSMIEDVRTENAATQKRINVATDIKHVKDVAINQLGMVYAGEGQIVYYSVDNDDYMNQYEDIPLN